MMSTSNGLIVTFEFPPHPGGIGTYAYQLAKQLSSSRVSVCVLATPSPEASYEPDEAFDQQLPFAVFRFRGANNRLVTVFHRIYLTLLLCRRHRFDWILCTTWRSAIGAFLCKAIWGTPYFIIGIGTEMHSAPSMSAFLMRQAAACIAISRYTAALMTARCSDCKVNVIPLGADADYYRPSAVSQHDMESLRARYSIHGTPILLSVGRLNARKGHDITLKALKQIRHHRPEAVLVIIGRAVPGSEQYETQLLEFIRESHLSQSVVIIPVVTPEELRALYAMADVFILSSRPSGPEVEGFGIVLIEANLMETPVIAANSGGIPDAIEEGKSGFLYPCGDADALAQQILRILDGELVKTMGEYGRQRALRDFSWQVVARRTFEVMSRAIDLNSRGDRT